ncbi:39S ribosomal protein L28, mitochondrial isoform X2 [Diprion similis]|uniref:39S ribosomal protein L28, mitochondrial isoform X2 n=1 Tax=Diprion similis TaxID=362088 RepID=UPI001EF89437|nr:39S ribosomal protein L28, mitochondrial isoform X2 [Diprion similis]
MTTNKLAQGMRLYYVKQSNRLEFGIGAEMPAAYKKFYAEWKYAKPTPVHYIEKEGKYERNEATGEVYPIQNVPLPLKYPKESHQGLWGGEAVIQGFQKRHPDKQKIPHFWVPALKRSVVYSEVLDKYMRVTLTERTLDLIHKNYGFDYYLLKTPAYDLKSELALKLKKKILEALSEKSLYPNDPIKKEKVYSRYEQYLSAYTKEEIEWYGLNWHEACVKMFTIKAAQTVIAPLKHQYRAELITELQNDTKKSDEAEESRYFMVFEA